MFCVTGRPQHLPNLYVEQQPSKKVADTVEHMTSPERTPKRSITTRTALVTVGGVIGVLAAGAVAVAANFSILAAADSDELGNLSATDLTIAADTSGETFGEGTAETASVTSSTSPASASGDVNTTRAYQVGDSGVVTVETAGGMLRVVGVDMVDGWSSTVEQISPTALNVMFSDTIRTFTFSAALGGSEDITVSVTDTSGVAGGGDSGAAGQDSSLETVNVTTPPAPTPPPAPSAPTAAQPANTPPVSTTTDANDTGGYVESEHDDERENEADDERGDDERDNNDEHEYDGRDDDD